MSQIITSKVGNYNNTLAKNKISKANDILTHTHDIDLKDYALKTDIPDLTTLIETQYPLRNAKMTANDFKFVTVSNPTDAGTRFDYTRKYNRTGSAGQETTIINKWSQIKEINEWRGVAIFGARKWIDSDNTIHLSFYIAARGDGWYYGKYPFNLDLTGKKYYAYFTDDQLHGGDGDASYVKYLYPKYFYYRQYSDGSAVNFVNITFYPFI